MVLYMDAASSVPDVYVAASIRNDVSISSCVGLLLNSALAKPTMIVVPMSVVPHHMNR